MLLIVGSLVAALATGATAQPSPEASGISAFADTSEKRFSRLLGAYNYADFKPALQRRTGPVRVLLQLTGASVAERDAKQNLTAAQRNAIRAQLQQQQQGIAAQVAALGGTVVFSYQDAVNGMSVTIGAGKLAELGAIPGVKRVRIARTYTPDNTASAQFVNAPTVWNGPTGFKGQGIKIAIIDTGVDYTHATFGGKGTEAAYEDADKRDTTLEGDEFNEKVIGGYDFVGDDYDASAAPDDPEEPGDPIPHPDPDPLDCDGHGSHVAGTAAGYGVNQNGTTYRGPYTPTTHATVNFLIGPGMAPLAQILAYRVFGCGGSASEDVVVAAINRAVADDADVINMSLGSPFGRTDELGAIASNNAALAGVSVIASAGNSGRGAYITGSPSVADRAVAVAAMDASRAEFLGASINLQDGSSVPSINANEAPLPAGQLQVKVLRNPNGTVALGCNQSDYVGVAGKLVVVVRGSCARVARAVYGQKAGAAAVVMINTSTAFPPFEGPIESNPDTGEEYLVTIPFLGVRGVLGPSPVDDGDRLVAADGQSVTLTPTTVRNPGFMTLASFTSNGPRNVDSFQKPDVTAPGVSVFSTNVDSGFRGAYFSGTSMAAPVTAGVAALVRQAHPTWSPEFVKGALMNTAEAGPSKIASGYDPQRAGAGAIQADRAVATVALTTTAGGRNTLSYGYDQLTAAYSENHSLTIHNTGGTALTYNLTVAPTDNQWGADFTFSENPVAVPAGGSKTINVTASLTAAEVAALPDAVASNFGFLAHAVRGNVVATPTAAGPGLYALRVPYMWVPRGLSNVEVTGMTSGFQSAIQVRNTGIHAGLADPFIWALEDPKDTTHPEGSTDIRAVGLQVLPREALCGSDPIGACGTGLDRALVFAINVHGFYSTPSVSEFDIAIDTDNDGEADFFVVGIDIGAVLAGSFDGRFASLIFDAQSGDLVNAWVAEAPLNGSTMLLPLLASDIGLGTRQVSLALLEPFTFQVASFSLIPGDDGDEATPDVNTFDDVTEVAEISTQAILRSGFTPNPVALAPGATGVIELPLLQRILPNAFTTGAKGWMIVTHDDANGAPQADLVPAP